VDDARTGAGLSRGVDAALAAALLAIDPHGLGVSLRARPGPSRDAWLALSRALLHPEAVLRKLPASIADDRLLGGLDLAATLDAGRPIAGRGLLAETDGGVLIIPLAERLPTATAARIAGALDTGEVSVERESVALRFPARFGVIALDESDDDERPPAVLLDRLAFHLDLEMVASGDIATSLNREDIAAARERVPHVEIGEEAIEALCAGAVALGIVTLTASILALKAARAAAALADEGRVDQEHVALAARLVLAPRATLVPALDAIEETEQPDPSPPDSAEADDGTSKGGGLEEVVLAAALAAIPPRLLASLTEARASRARSGAVGHNGGKQQTMRGRPAGTRRGLLRSGTRLSVIDTLRAAAPWQTLRRRGLASDAGRRRIEVRRDDFRIRRFKKRNETVTVFVVDASGSSALHRLAEAKGAIELLLADCYIRRDQVALLAFGGRGAQLLLPPTRSLTRAKRRLADLPGGGGTPLAEALEQANCLVASIRRRHQTPALVVLTDGRPNLARDGRKGRGPAEDDALSAARVLRTSGVASLLIDTSSRAEASAARIAEAMGARYVPLPHADARTVSEEVRARIGGRVR
jgi:magnesium chelatase subunit D